jgi:ABC-type branched-subunit amino acid transport system substrate-binding protein
VIGRRFAAVAAVIGVALAGSTQVIGAQSGKQAPKATEVGVSASTIRIAVVADVENPAAPGLFAGSPAAIQAFAKYINKNGGLAGRKLAVDFIDSHLSADDARSAVIKACAEDFAIVGTAALFLSNIDDMVACADKAGNPTGLPDIPILSTEIEHQCSPVSFGPNPSQLDCATKDSAPQKWRSNVGAAKYFRRTFGKDLHGTYLYGNDLKAAAIGGLALIRGAVAAGIKSDNEIGISARAPQTEYTPVVQRLKEASSNYSLNTGPFSSSVALRKEAKLQGVDPTSVVWECFCYDRHFIEQGGADVDGEFVRISHLPYTDTKNAAVRNFVKFTPDDKVDSFAAFAWVAGFLFRDAVNAVVKKGGDNALTRRALFDALHGIKKFDADGMWGTTNIADKVPTPCFVLMQVKGGKFQRVHPTKPGTFDCKPSNNIVFSSDIIGT